MKDFVIILAVCMIAIILFVGFTAWTNDIDCTKYMETNPDKEIRAVGITKKCKVNYGGIWIDTLEFRHVLPD